eukprot:COSAG01_NODE_12527_length_1725_cov_3.493235_2_plen_237_part_00
MAGAKRKLVRFGTHSTDSTRLGSSSPQSRGSYSGYPGYPVRLAMGPPAPPGVRAPALAPRAPWVAVCARACPPVRRLLRLERSLPCSQLASADQQTLVRLRALGETQAPAVRTPFTHYFQRSKRRWEGGAQAGGVPHGSSPHSVLSIRSSRQLADSHAGESYATVLGRWACKSRSPRDSTDIPGAAGRQAVLPTAGCRCGDRHCPVTRGLARLIPRRVRTMTARTTQCVNMIPRKV